ncbi:uncharacterized protein [Haliotis cracherodii]|uniref:uncharacterized protein n=1 Tax=Haliotis cracherodii TaxID=6455 RepID=UPI0039E95F4F
MIGVTRRILDSMLAETRHRHLTHEVLSTFMAEVSAIVNARPIVPISSDPQSPEILTPAILLTQKTNHEVEQMELCDSKDLLRSQWQRVQSLANTFWNRWRQEYLLTLQPRRKWFQDQRNVLQGDLVLLNEKNSARNDWPIAVVERAFPSSDGKVRKVELRIMRGGKITRYIRPVTELVTLLSPNSDTS